MTILADIVIVETLTVEQRDILARYLLEVREKVLTGTWAHKSCVVDTFGE